ncbi:predicted protein [Uncinocarpus reesii 1704]|uniref:Uncharacterized protein n=1 Tax=Uncinocarpus reesii (strain UAMH 1704) TaxID=336963 RepID=C4JIM6_UNCRE|nr:uncharacterized protein UREG_02887 [Uncinocarpus reesii 1704]EEP78038.1 predicted protein [Uncinocarpus reesii 1704]
MSTRRSKRFTPPISSEAPSSDRSRRLKVILSITLGTLALFAVMLGFCIFWVRRRRYKLLEKDEQLATEPADEVVVLPSASPRGEYPHLLDSKNVRAISPVELEATPVRQSFHPGIVAK